MWTNMQIKRKPNIFFFIPRVLLFPVVYFQIPLCDASFVWGLCCSWAVTNLILKQGVEILHILDRHWNISWGASSEHSMDSGTKGAGNTLPWNGRELNKSIEFCISHRRVNFDAKERARFQAYLSLSCLDLWNCPFEPCGFHHFTGEEAFDCSFSGSPVLLGMVSTLNDNRNFRSLLCLHSYHFTTCGGDHMFLISKYEY